MGFIPSVQDCFNVQKSINIIIIWASYKWKAYDFIKDTKRAFDKIWHQFMMSTLRKLEIKGNSSILIF